MLIIWIVIFIVSLAVLIKSADYFTKSASKVGLILGLSPFVIGVTIVSIGTSLPELVSSISATVKGATEFVAANVIGSNIANILLIIGLTAVIAKKIEVKRDLINLDLPLLSGATIMFFVMTLWDGRFTMGEGIIALLTYAIYFHYTIKFKEKVEMEPGENPKHKHHEKFSLKLILTLVGGAIGIYFGANYMVEATLKISEILNIGTSVIALSAVAVGTSLPELVVSITAAIKKDYEVALGNVFGSNIFNGCVVIGISSLIRPLTVSAQVVTIALPFLLIATILYVISGITRKIYSWEGAIYLLLYVLFIVKIFNLF